MFTIPILINLDNNPNIKILKFKIESYVNKNKNKQTILGNYLIHNLDRIIQTQKEMEISKYKLNNNIITIDLNLSWDLLKNFKKIPVIYQFIIGSDSYIGSTKDIYNRCFIQHKNKALTSKNIHTKFYSRVKINGWNNFTLKILSIIPNHTQFYAEKYTESILTDNDIQILQYLTSYELTYIEQIYLDLFKPSLNSNLLANWSTYNKGSKGYIRNKISNEKLSFSFLNRSFTNETKELHRKNNTGKVLSDSTKLKMSKSSGGVNVKLIDINSNNSIIEFKTKSSLAKELNISIRTINR